MSSTLIVQLDMERFCEEANIPATYVIEIVEHGIIEPQGRTPDVWRFEDYELVIARRAAKLRDDLQMEWGVWRWRWTCSRKCSSCVLKISD